MNCATCARPNPEDARFCIYCAVSLTAAEQTPGAEATPGPTVPLDARATTPAPAAAPPTPGAQSRSTPPWFAAQHNEEITGAIWLIGLGLIFLTGAFWPGILVLAGLTAYVQEAARGRQAEGLQELVTLTGIAFLFWTGLFWPGILILLGIVALLSPELRRRPAA